MSSRFPRPSPFRPLLRRFTDERARDLAETKSLYERVRAAYISSGWSNPNSITDLSARITDAVAERFESSTYLPIADALDTCQREVLALETLIFTEPQTDFSKPLSLKEQIDLNRDLKSRERLLACGDEMLGQLGNTVADFRGLLIESLPEIGDGLFRVPLIALIKNPLVFLGEIIGIFFKEENLDSGLFNKLGGRIIDNIDAFSGISGPDSKKPLIWPSDSGLSAEEAVSTYFAGTPVHTLLLTPCPFSIPLEQRFSGHWIIAPPGRGKTTLLHTMLLSDIDEDASIIIIDSKGDLLDPIKRLDHIKDRLLLIEPSAEYALALNPLDVSRSNVMHAVNMIEYIMAGLLDAKFTALQSTLFRNVVPAMIAAFDNPTLETFKTVMVNGLPREALPKLDAHARAFFDNRETGFHSKTYESTRKEVVWRLDYLMTNPILRTMFSAVQTRLDIGKEMDAGKVILINNSKSALTDEGAEFFGRFFIALIVRAAQQRGGRPQDEKLPCFVYIDECQTVIAKDTRIPTLLDECRSQNIGLILAHQRSAQLTNPVLDAVANCAIRMANSDDEAKFLSDKIRMSVDELRSLPRGSFGTFIRDFSPPGFVLKSPRYDLSRLPQMTDAELHTIRTRMKTEFSSTVPEHSEVAASATFAQPRPPLPPSKIDSASTLDGLAAPCDPGEAADSW